MAVFIFPQFLKLINSEPMQADPSEMLHQFPIQPNSQTAAIRKSQKGLPSTKRYNDNQKNLNFLHHHRVFLTKKRKEKHQKHDKNQEMTNQPARIGSSFLHRNHNRWPNPKASLSASKLLGMAQAPRFKQMTKPRTPRPTTTYPNNTLAWLPNLGTRTHSPAATANRVEAMAAQPHA